MELDLDPDQQALVQALEHLTQPFLEAPRQGVFAPYAPKLQALLREGEFDAVQLQPGLGPLEAALVVDVVGRAPYLAETGVSVLVAPALLGRTVPGPVAVVDEVARPARFLSVARHAFVRRGADVVLVEVAADAVEPLSGMFAYPYGRFKAAPDLTAGEPLPADKRTDFDRLRRVALAAEAASAMTAALEATIEYVTHRRQFGQPLGAFQAVQHRISRNAVHARGARLLALEAAWKGDALTAALAAVYAQRFAGEAIEDLHQFNGALGITLDHPLHYWTYRLLALQGELGGLHVSAEAAAAEVWPEGAPPPPGPEPATAYSQLGW
ncbi:MAG: hypothetical protein JO127_19810 [Caulobacteraceae bacterium]|nr:hypothetical protein [Caulobacteraceae bacterium]